MPKARFVPFALFVAVASILVMSTLCVLPLIHVSTRVLILVKAPSLVSGAT